MESKGYKELSDRFLTKDFATENDKKNIYHINITIDNEIITAITGYNSEDEVVAIPDTIVEAVQEDIDESL